MIVLVITNIILAVAIGTAGIALLVDMVRDSRPIIIKEAKALREYYEVIGNIHENPELLET